MPNIKVVRFNCIFYKWNKKISMYFRIEIENEENSYEDKKGIQDK
jgi:hypothetical protein